MPLDIKVIGAGATAPSEHGGASSYLVSTDSGYILVDAGPGSLLSFYQQGYALTDLRAIVLTHLHADHSVDMMAWAYRWTFPERLNPIPLLFPTGEKWRLEKFDDIFGIPTLPTMHRPITGNFELMDMPMDGTTTVLLDGVELTTYQARHAVPSASLRFESAGRTLAFSSDTGDCEGVRTAAFNADVFVSEATYLDPRPLAMKEHGHLTPALAGQISQDCGVRHLILTHFEFPGNGVLSAERARSTFDGKISVAEAGAVIHT